MTHTKRIASATMILLAATLILGGCSCFRRINNTFDPPLNYAGREQICLSNLERLLDAKQEWSKETGAGVGAMCPSSEVLAHRYFRMYEYGRRTPCNDNTQNLPVNRAICPGGGEYVIGTVGERPKCSVHGDLLRDFDQHIRVTHTH